MDFRRKLPPNWHNPMGLPPGKVVLDPGRAFVDGMTRQVEGWRRFWDSILPLAGRIQSVLDRVEGARVLTVNLGAYRLAKVDWPCDIRGLLQEGSEKWLTGHGLPPQVIRNPSALDLGLWATGERYDPPLTILRVEPDGSFHILGRR